MPKQNDRPMKNEIQVSKEVDGETVTANIKESALRVYARHGWTPVDDGSSETGPEEAPLVADKTAGKSRDFGSFDDEEQ